MSQKNRKTFTLIEMLIVIVIIGILASALIPRLQSVQGRARDTKRKVDLRQIYNANEIYFSDNSSYPVAYNCTYNVYTCWAYSTTGTTSWASSGTAVYMTSIPKDPVNNASQPWVTGNLSYAYGQVYNTPIHTYDLIAQLENRQDPDRCGVKGYKWNADGLNRCGSLSSQIYDLSPNVTNQ